jgi:hypothetical protein
VTTDLSNVVSAGLVLPLAKLTPADLSAVYAAMVNEGSAPRTAGHPHRVLGRALREAEVAGLVARNVARVVKPPRVPHAEMHTLSGTQARTLLEAATTDRLWRAVSPGPCVRRSSG